MMAALPGACACAPCRAQHAPCGTGTGPQATAFLGGARREHHLSDGLEVSNLRTACVACLRRVHAVRYGSMCARHESTLSRQATVHRGTWAHWHVWALRHSAHTTCVEECGQASLKVVCCRQRGIPLGGAPPATHRAHHEAEHRQQTRHQGDVGQGEDGGRLRLHGHPFATAALAGPHLLYEALALVLFGVEGPQRKGRVPRWGW